LTYGAPVFRSPPGVIPSMIGSDQHFPELKNGPQRSEAVVVVWNQLPAELGQKIGTENAIRIYR
jgi:hypothetical protein